MSRSKWKGPYVDAALLSLVNVSKPTEVIFTKSRNSTIIPCFVGLLFKVHNGKIFYQVKITEEMIGYKLGEFAPTRKSFSFKKQKQKQ